MCVNIDGTALCVRAERENRGLLLRGLFGSGGLFGSATLLEFLFLIDDHANRSEHLILELNGQLRVFTQELLGLLAALTELITVVGVPSTGLLDDPFLHRHVEQAALAGDTFATRKTRIAAGINLSSKCSNKRYA